jgi:16S rRNA (uracil1498-N3)-methyltransferase
MRCFFCENIIEGEIVTLSREDEKHLFKTLRARAGEIIQLNDGKGGLAEAEILPGRQIIVRKIDQFPEPAIKLHLYVAPPRRNKMDTMLKQCAETGVFRIVPIITMNSVATPEGKASERQHTLLREGCKQSRNPFLPQLSAPLKFSDALAEAATLGAVFYGAMTKENIIPTLPAQPLNIGFFIGPEGGFTDSEIAQMVEQNFIPISLGTWIMRTETAAVAGSTLLQYLLKT